MSLESSKLENVQLRSDGALIARCPACSEEGRDQGGNHLIVLPDGRFGCVVNSGDDDNARRHRREIWVLAGKRDGQNFSRTPKRRLVLTPWQTADD